MLLFHFCLCLLPFPCSFLCACPCLVYVHLNVLFHVHVKRWSWSLLICIKCLCLWLCQCLCPCPSRVSCWPSISSHVIRYCVRTIPPSPAVQSWADYLTLSFRAVKWTCDWHTWFSFISNLITINITPLNNCCMEPRVSVFFFSTVVLSLAGCLWPF